MVKKLYKIGEVSKILNLINPKNKKLNTHTIRFWENKFKQIKSKKINKVRYFSSEQIETIKLIKYLLKNKGLTLNGVKNVLESNINKLDDYNSYSLKADYYKTKLKKKSTEVLKKIRNLKRYGKKISYKGKNGS